MRDLMLLRFTLQAIRSLGDDAARVVQDGVGHHFSWHAGPQPLNAQAVQDLVGDGWLRMSADGREVRLDTWPSFANSPAERSHG